MKTSIRVAVSAVLVGIVLPLSGYGHAQQTSEIAGSISKVAAEGYVFSGGTPLGPEIGKFIVAPNKVSYEVKYRLGFAYFAKGADFLVCQYEIVTVNPIPDHLRLGKPESKCFRIR